MDREYLIGLFGGNDFPDGTPIMDHIEEIREFQKWFIEEVHKTREEHVFTYPVLTYSLLYQNQKFIDEDFARWCNAANLYWMDSNFFVGSSVTSLSSCCRLINDTTKLSAFINSIGGTALQVGSVKVSTVNLRRIALESYGDEEEFLTILRDRLHVNLMALDRQRHIIKRNIEKGLLPNYTSGLVEMEKQYSTIGITALYEALVDFGYIAEDETGNKYF
jgi:ribonucleoside-triphosphate reductase